MFRIDVPPDWILIRAGELDYGVLSPGVVEDFQPNFFISVFEGAAAPASLEAFVTRAINSWSAEPSLKERLLHRRATKVDGRPAEELVSVDQKGLQYVSTLVVADGRGFQFGGVAPARIHDRFAPTFARIMASVRLAAPKGAPKPLLVKALLLPAQFGGQDIRPNRTWLYPRAVREREAFDAKVVQQIRATGESVVYAATPIYDRAVQVPSFVEIVVRSPSGAELLKTRIANPPE